GPDSSEDPHVERLIEAFAYLNARTRRKLEDDFPEITEALLGVLYPHYQLPIPSLAIVQFDLAQEQNGLTAGATLPRHTQLETEPIQGLPCHFRTCYPVPLHPIELRHASLSRPPFAAPSAPQLAQAAAVLRLVLGCRDAAVNFADLTAQSLRFFLKGQPQHVYRLYELLFNHALGVALASGADDPAPVLLDKERLRPVGLERDEGLLPYTARSFVGYRLLTELFAFAPKFLFADLAGLGDGALSRAGNQLEVFIYLNRETPDLEQNVSADTFRLGCTPVVNLYPQRAEPIPLTQTDYEHRVVPDVRRPLAHEVYSIDRVTASARDGTAVEFRPFFSVKHADEGRAGQTFWHAVRRQAENGTGATDPGQEVFLSLVDLELQPAAPANWTVGVETTCLNRDLPARLPFGGDQPRLQLSEGGALVGRVSCLT